MEWVPSISLSLSTDAPVANSSFKSVGIRVRIPAGALLSFSSSTTYLET